MIGDVLLQPAIHARRLDAQGESEDVHDPLAGHRPDLLRQRGFRVRTPSSDLGDPPCCGLHLGDSGEVASEDQISELFERIGGGELACPIGGVAACSSR